MGGPHSRIVGRRTCVEKRRKTMENNILDQFGIGEMPWIMRVYILLFFSTLALILLPGLTIFNFSEQTINEIISIGKDALKIVIGAVIGSLSMAAHKEWSKPPSPAEER